MALRGTFTRFAFGVPQAFPILGLGGKEPWEQQLTDGTVRMARAPHDADLLLLAGEIPYSWSEPIRRLFETLPLPRSAVWLAPSWSCPDPDALPFARSLEEARSKLRDRTDPGHRPILPDEPPAPWRGEGDHGQGGKGMMGGKPYGRAMAMNGPDQDGLMLNEVPTSMGPFFPGLPAGLHPHLRLQGDRISAVDGVQNLFPDWQPTLENAAQSLTPALAAARGEDQSVALMERMRIESHLTWAASFLDLAGLHALGQRFMRSRHATDPHRIERLFAAARVAGLRPLCHGLGKISSELAQELDLVGPVARASGPSEDLRISDGAYQDLGFQPVVDEAGDVWARWEVRRRECLASARLLAQAGDLTTLAAEGPRGALRIQKERIVSGSRRNLKLLERLLPGLLWSEAVLVVASLDLDMAEAALA